MKDIGAWLADLGLSKYADVFAEHEIEFIDLSELTERDLVDMGLPLGPRRRVLRALREQATPNPSPVLSDPPAAESAEAAIVAERRQLTVMFIDLVGSTALSEKLDPEDLAEVLRVFKQTSTAAVTDFDGHVASYLGDGILVFFGYPHAHEDDAARAIHAGLRVIREVPEIRTHAKLNVRIGVATGLVVVGDLRGTQLIEGGTAMGETPNLAARLQSMAEPGTLIVAPATRQLAGDNFEYVERGTFKLKGFTKPVRAWQVMSTRELVSRFMATDSTKLNPMIGREQDYETLFEKWRFARGGAGQLVLVSGEAGIGKSRLIEELRVRIASEPSTTLRYQCSPYHETSAFYPVIRQLQRSAGLRPDDPDDIKLDKISRVLRNPSDLSLKLAASLLSIPFEEILGTLDLSPQQVMEKTQEMLVSHLCAQATRKPILLLFEDAHWIDPTTKSLLDRLVARVSDVPILLVLSYRTGFEPGWDLRSYLTHLPLTHLDFAQVSCIVDEVAKGKSVPTEIYTLIAARTNGVPLYVEEVAKDLLESDLVVERETAFVLSGPLPTLTVPSALQDSLMARLDRLGLAKEVAQIGAVFGPQFSIEMLLEVSSSSEDGLRRDIDRLVEAGIIALSDAGASEVYRYRHALIRDTAYNSLLKSERQSLHAAVANALKQDEQNSIDAGPELLAFHYTMANMADEAINHWHIAGQRAIERSANLEAAVQLAKAIELLLAKERSPERDSLEIEIQVLRAGTLRSNAGIAADDTGQVYARIRDLCHRAGETEHLFPVMNGLYAFHLVRAEYDHARDVAGQLLDLAEQSIESHHSMVAHRAMGAVLLHVGEFRASCEHLEQALELYNPKEHGRLAYIYGTDHAAITSSFLSMVVWMLGEPDRALRIQNQAVAAARALNHAHSVAQALTFLCMLHLLRRDVEKTRLTAKRLEKLSKEHSFAFMSVTATFWVRWADAQEHPNTETIRALHEAAKAWWSGGAGNYKPFFLTLLAELKVNAGDKDGALRLLAEAREYQELTNERWAQAETDRVYALAQSSAASADAAFETAMTTARGQQASMFALRIAVDCAAHGPGTEAQATYRPDLRQMLAAVEGGADAEDVIAARRLIERKTTA